MRYLFIGWCAEGIHDKVWGAIALDSEMHGKVLTVWGRRGKKMQTKMARNDSDLRKLIDSKRRNKGYQEIDTARLNHVYPDFQADLEKTAIWETLKL